MTLRILGKSRSINVRKVLWTCAEIGLPWRLEPFGAQYSNTRGGVWPWRPSQRMSIASRLRTRASPG